MTRFKIVACCSALTIAGALQTFAITPDSSPFQNIAVANIFRLHAPEKAKRVEIPQLPLPPISLTGIFDGFDKLFVLIEVSPPNQAKMLLKLGPGEREGDVQVLKVDIKAGTVQVRIFDTVTNLILNQIAPPPPTATKALGTAVAVPALSPAASPVQPQLSRDQSALIIEAERERLRQAGDPTANLMPITQLTPVGAPGTEGSDFEPSGTRAALLKRAPQPR